MIKSSIIDEQNNQIVAVAAAAAAPAVCATAASAAMRRACVSSSSRMILSARCFLLSGAGLAGMMRRLRTGEAATAGNSPGSDAARRFRGVTEATAAATGTASSLDGRARALQRGWQA